MKFWDTSALLPLLIKEASSSTMKKLYEESSEVIVWWGTEIECISALARREREESVSITECFDAGKRLQEILSYVAEVGPSLEIKRIAKRLLKTHPLRAADALQLAAAISVAGENLSDLTMVTLDNRLKHCAEREGLQVVP